MEFVRKIARNKREGEDKREEDLEEIKESGQR